VGFTFPTATAGRPDNLSQCRSATSQPQASRTAFARIVKRIKRAIGHEQRMKISGGINSQPPLRFRSGQYFCADIAESAQLLMLKTSLDSFDYWSGSPARLGFGAYMNLCASVRGLKRLQASRAVGFVGATLGATALIAWWSGLPTLANWGSGFATAKPSNR
jgi:hypothetical protein